MHFSSWSKKRQHGNLHWILGVDKRSAKTGQSGTTGLISLCDRIALSHAVLAPDG